MRSFKAATILLLASLSFICAYAPDAVDYLSAGKQLNFNKQNYLLAWSSNPTSAYYKQEYTLPGKQPGALGKMLLLEAIEGNTKAADALKAKVQELEYRKKWDFVANYQVYRSDKKPKEAIIDFVVSDTTVHYEWNLYRFQEQTGKDNKKYMVLFAYTYRDSLNDNNDLKKFFDVIKNTRIDMIDKLQAYDIPKVNIVK